MAHNIEIVNGVASYAENGRQERAWHGLGQVFDRPMTVDEALKASHADFEVQKCPLVALNPTLSKKLADENYSLVYLQDEVLDAIVPGRNATIRTDTMKPLGVVSDTYGVVQNSDAFRFIDTLCTGGLTSHAPVIECAGVLGHGERIFITAKFPENIRLDNQGNDIVEMYVVFTTSHDGSSAVNALVTPTRVVCNNTLNFAMRNNSGRLSLKHTTNVMSRLDLAKKENAEFAYKTLNLYSVYKQSLEESFEAMRRRELTEKRVEQILAELVLSEEGMNIYARTGNIQHEDISTRSKNTYIEMRNAIESGVGQEYGEHGTGMWLINGLTTYFQNSCRYRNEEKKLHSILDGHAKRNLQRAYDLIGV